MLLVLAVAACGDDSDPTPGTDGGTTGPGIDGGPMTTDSGGAMTADSGTGGGSTVGRVCANDTNCTGTGETCCLESSPYVCRLATDCMTVGGGIPCTASADCPSSRICCRLDPDTTMCMRTMDCTALGGDEVP